MNLNHPDDGRFGELLNDPHVKQAVERAMKAQELVAGVRDCPDFDTLLREVCHQISILEVNPDIKNTWGLVIVTRGPMDGYSIYVRSADVFNVHMAGYFDRPELSKVRQ